MAEVYLGGGPGGVVGLHGDQSNMDLRYNGMFQSQKGLKGNASEEHAGQHLVASTLHSGYSRMHQKSESASLRHIWSLRDHNTDVQKLSD